MLRCCDAVMLASANLAPKGTLWTQQLMHSAQSCEELGIICMDDTNSVQLKARITAEFIAVHSVSRLTRCDSQVQVGAQQRANSAV